MFPVYTNEETSEIRNNGRVPLGLFRNRITRNRRYSCSFGSYSVFGMNGISLNERNTVYSKYTEYAFFWEIFGGKSNAATIVVLRSPLP